MSESPPSLFRLVADGFVSEPTKVALLARLEPVGDQRPKALSESAFGALTVLCSRLRPRTFRPTGVELAVRIDALLASGRGDGWRYDALPDDREAYEVGLKAIAAEAECAYGERLETLNGESVDALIRALQQGTTRTEWPFPAIRFLEDLLAEVTGLAYAQPCAQAAIGYIGYADARGWKRVGPNEREEWER